MTERFNTLTIELHQLTFDQLVALGQTLYDIDLPDAAGQVEMEYEERSEREREKEEEKQSDTSNQSTIE